MTPTFLAVKLIDIGLVTVYFFLIGMFVASGIDKMLGPFKKEHYTTKSTVRIAVEIVMQLFALGIIAYFLRNIVERIPFPLEGVAGFQHARLKEIEGGIVLPFVLLFFQRNLSDKFMYFKERVFGHGGD